MRIQRLFFAVVIKTTNKDKGNDVMKKDSNEYPDPDILTPNDVVSTTECTGLIQALPIEEDNIEPYSEIYDIPDQAGLGLLEEELDKVMKKQSEQE